MTNLTDLAQLSAIFLMSRPEGQCLLRKQSILQVVALVSRTRAGSGVQLIKLECYHRISIILRTRFQGATLTSTPACVI